MSLHVIDNLYVIYNLFNMYSLILSVISHLVFKVFSLSSSVNDWGRAQLFVGQVSDLSDELVYLKMDHKENFKTLHVKVTINYILSITSCEGEY
jgi:hypothetical protein